MEQYCDCKYNEQCESTRQYVQQIIRGKDKNKTIESCDFYGYIKEKAICPKCKERPKHASRGMQLSLCLPCITSNA